MSLLLALCENLEKPEARASLIWIIGEYAEKIDNADDLLESFLNNLDDENPQVQLQLVTAILKLFLKRPTDTQELVQQVLSLVTQDSKNPDLRDRGFVYWRLLLSTDPAAAKEVVLAEKPLIAEETDLLEPTLLDELICHIASLASVYHKPPTAFVEGKVGLKRMLPARAGDTDSEQKVAGAIIIPDHGSIFGDQGGAPAPDLLGGGLDQLLARGHPERTAAAASKSLLGYIFGMGGAAPVGFVPPKHVWLSLVSNIIHFEMTFRNKVMQGFGIQLKTKTFLVWSAPSPSATLL
jgi:AP-1 complex subunit beta-1